MPPRSANLQHVSTTYITQDSEVTVTSGTAAAPGGEGRGHASHAGPVQIAVGEDPEKSEILKLREMLLSDNSVQSS